MPNSPPPPITIGITAFNAAETLSRAVESALAQNWPNKEILIVDDCSTDGTAGIIQKYVQSHPIIRSFRQQTNKGVAAARNVLLREAKGDYLAFFDDDDISLPERLEKQYDRINGFQGKDLVLCHTARRQVYPDGHERIEETPGYGDKTPEGFSMFERILLGKTVKNGFGSLATCSLMMSRHVFEKIGIYDENFRRSEDMDFTLRFALAGGLFAGIEEPLVIQTMTKSSEKSLHDERRYHEQIYQKYKTELGKSKTDFAIKWLDLRYEFLLGKKTIFAFKFLRLFATHPILSLKKILWAFPNAGFNLNFKKFHQENND